MPQKKKQHYVPKFYLKNFSKDKKFYVINVNKNKEIGLVPYGDQCYSDYFYGKDGVFEDQFSDMENTWRQVINKVIQGDALNEEDANRLKEFAVYQRLRTEAEYDHNFQAYADSYVENAKMNLENRGIIFDEKDKQECYKFAKDHYDENSTLTFAEKALGLIRDLNVTILKYKTNNSLISSDAPILMLNGFSQNNGYGFLSVGIALVFPVDNQSLVVISDGGIYNNNSLEYVDVSNEEDVINLNKLQYISANEIVYSNEAFDVSNFDKRVIDLRASYRDCSPISSIGPKKRKIIVNSTRRVPNEYTLSFLKLPHKFLRIPSKCRDDILLRTWSRECEQRFYIRGRVLFELIKGGSNTIMSEKSYRKGIQRLHIEMVKYWQNNNTYNVME